MNGVLNPSKTYKALIFRKPECIAGRVYADTTLTCAVVATYISHERESIICMCRDGHIREWSFRPSHNGAMNSKKRKRRKRLKDGDDDDDNEDSKPPARRSTRTTQSLSDRK